MKAPPNRTAAGWSYADDSDMRTAPGLSLNSEVRVHVLFGFRAPEQNVRGFGGICEAQGLGMKSLRMTCLKVVGLLRLCTLPWRCRVRSLHKRYCHRAAHLVHQRQE